MFLGESGLSLHFLNSEAARSRYDLPDRKVRPFAQVFTAENLASDPKRLLAAVNNITSEFRGESPMKRRKPLKKSRVLRKLRQLISAAMLTAVAVTSPMDLLAQTPTSPKAKATVGDIQKTPLKATIRVGDIPRDAANSRSSGFAPNSGVRNSGATARIGDATAVPTGPQQFAAGSQEARLQPPRAPRNLIKLVAPNYSRGHVRQVNHVDSADQDQANQQTGVISAPTVAEPTVAGPAIQTPAAPPKAADVNTEQAKPAEQPKGDGAWSEELPLGGADRSAELLKASEDRKAAAINKAVEGKPLAQQAKDAASPLQPAIEAPGTARAGDATQTQPTQATPKLIATKGQIRTSVGDSRNRQYPKLARKTNDVYTHASLARAMQQQDGNFEIIDASNNLTVNVLRSKLLRAPFDIYRVAVVDQGICEVAQHTPREVSIIGKSTGATHVTFWFDGGDRRPVTYLVNVDPDIAVVTKREKEYALLEQLLRNLFPNSKVYLQVIANKLIIRGQAKDSEEAAKIMAILRTQSFSSRNSRGSARGSLNDGQAVAVLDEEATGDQRGPNLQIINMLTVPGVQQVALRVKIAELTRSAGRGLNVNFNADVNFKDQAGGALFINSLLAASGGGASSLLTQFDADDIEIGIDYLQQQGVVRVLSEPTLVTMSGRPATFHAGGEFAVPTVVGSAGLNAVSTQFRAYGAIISFLPVVIDKDKIRLDISPEFSAIDGGNSVGGTPGLSVRAVTTTVEMREGQTLAIAGLLDDSMTANRSGNLPFLTWLIGSRSVSRNETELIILVTPELIHPMDAEETPPLPGFDVTEPNGIEFFLNGKIEGHPSRDFRSTVWPRLRNRYHGPDYTSGPFGHGT
jgi:pilus assembly protein CpaC